MLSGQQHFNVGSSNEFSKQNFSIQFTYNLQSQIISTTVKQNPRTVKGWKPSFLKSLEYEYYVGIYVRFIWQEIVKYINPFHKLAAFSSCHRG